jgi:hypothetical protein
MREMRDYQYHYANCEVGPAEVMPAFLSDEREGLQLQALLRELEKTIMRFPARFVNWK